MKTVITMTSWAKRIDFVAKSIYTFLTTQTKQPDEFYLWLAIEEFPKKENDLPIELLKICKYFNVKISWCQHNEGCHKRWYVYPLHYEDLVISIDDDQKYANDLIELSQKLAIEGPNNTTYNIWFDLTFPTIYRGIRHIKHLYAFDARPSIFKTFNGQHIFPPKTFPLDAVSENNIELRKQYCPICDECWLSPFLKYNNIEIGSTLSLFDETEVSSYSGTFPRMARQVFNTLTVQDLQLYLVLKLFPDKMTKWKLLYPSYITNEFDNMDINMIKTELFKWLY